MKNNAIAFPLFGTAGGTFIPVFHFLYGEGPTRFAIMVLYLGLIGLDWIAGYCLWLFDRRFRPSYLEKYDGKCYPCWQG